MSLLSHYTWNENDTANTRDYTTIGNDSTAMVVTSILLQTTLNEIGYVVNLDGVNDVITFGDINDFGGTDTLSIVAKLRTGGAGPNPVAHKEGQYTVGIDVNDKAFMKLSIGSSVFSVTSSASVSLGGNYKTVIWTYDGSAVGSDQGQIYIDGVLDVNTMTQTGNLDASSSDFKIGYDNTDYCHAKIEMVALYSETLSLANVTAITDKPGGFILDVPDSTQFSVGDLAELSDKGAVAGGQGTITGVLSATKLLYLPLVGSLPNSLDILKHRGNCFDTTRQCIYDSISNSGVPSLIMRDGVSTFNPPDSTIKVKLSCDETVLSSVEATGPVYFNNPITPAAFTTASQDDWTPTSISTTNMVRLLSTNGPGTTITGIAAPSPSKNQVIFLTNIGAKTIVLSNADAGSMPENRFEFKVNLSIQQNEGALIVYDRDDLRWKAIAINT